MTLQSHLEAIMEINQINQLEILARNLRLHQTASQWQYNMTLYLRIALVVTLVFKGMQYSVEVLLCCGNCKTDL